MTYVHGKVYKTTRYGDNGLEWTYHKSTPSQSKNSPALFDVFEHVTWDGVHGYWSRERCESEFGPLEAVPDRRKTERRVGDRRRG